MNNVSRPAPFFIADNSALDLLNSIANPADTEFDWLGNGNDLISWLEQADLLSKKELCQFRAKDKLIACDTIASEIRELREWFRKFVSTYAGQPLAASTLKEISPLNKILAKGNNYKQIEECHLEHIVSCDENIFLRWHACRHWHSPNDLLQVIAETMGDLVCTADFSLIKNCEGPTCTLWFYDLSKNHSRRWCTMSICGNRAKAALHRAKKKAAKITSAI